MKPVVRAKLPPTMHHQEAEPCRPHLIDYAQYANWSEKIFRQMREGDAASSNGGASAAGRGRSITAKASADAAGFPRQPDWFIDNRSLSGIATALRKVGFPEEDTGKLMGENWLRFFDENFGPEAR